MRHLRRSGTLTREEMAARTGLSSATVTRTVNMLLTLRLVRERHDLAVTGTRGRPHIPVQLDVRRHLVVGIHVGYRTSTLALGSLAGDVVSARLVPHAATHPDPADLAVQVGHLLNEHLDRVPLIAAVVAPFDRMGVNPHSFADQVSEQLGLEVSIGSQVGSLAGVEFMRRGYAASEPTTYLYLREVAGSVQMLERDGEVLTTHALDLAHLPTGSPDACWCGRTGCLEAAASDRAVAGRAVANGIIRRPQIADLVAAASAGSAAALEVLTDRAQVLGHAAALVRDLVRPAHLVLLGQAFTQDPSRHDVLRAAWNTTPAGSTDLSISTVGDELQASGAIATALGALFSDPKSALAGLT